MVNHGSLSRCLNCLRNYGVSDRQELNTLIGGSNASWALICVVGTMAYLVLKTHGQFCSQKIGKGVCPHHAHATYIMIIPIQV